MVLGIQVKQARQARNMTLADLASRSGLTKGFLSQLERGLSNPSLQSLGRIAAALDVPPDSLLGAPADSFPPVPEATAPAVFRRKQMRLARTPVAPLFQVRGGRFASVWLEPAATLEPPPGRPSRPPSRAVCAVLSGTVLLSQGGTEIVLEDGDVFTWSATEAYKLENRGHAGASLLLNLDAGIDLPVVRQDPQDRQANLKRAANEALVRGGPLRLVAMREQMRGHDRGGGR